METPTFDIVHSILADHSFNLDVNALVDKVHTISAKRKTISTESIQFRKCLMGFCKRVPSSRLPSLDRLLSRLPCDSPWVFPDRPNFHVKQTCDPVSNQRRFPNSGGPLQVRTDSISGQRRRRKYQRPTEGERRAINDAYLAGYDRKRDLKKSEGRHGQSSPAINTPARSSAGREAALSTIGWTTRARTCW